MTEKAKNAGARSGPDSQLYERIRLLSERLDKAVSDLPDYKLDEKFKPRRYRPNLRELVAIEAVRSFHLELQVALSSFRAERGCRPPGAGRRRPPGVAPPVHRRKAE